MILDAGENKVKTSLCRYYGTRKVNFTIQYAGLRRSPWFGISKELFGIALLLFTSSCLGDDSLVYEKEVAQSIGKVIMVHDTVWSYQDDSYRTGGFSISSTIDREYEKYVANKPAKYRMDFFWSIMMHVGLDASFFENFLILVNKDCGPEFIIRIDKFLNKSKELKINGPDQDRAKKVKSALLNMK